MARVDFYLLSQHGDDARQAFVCRLTNKAFGRQHTIHIRTDDQQRAERMDEALWTFQDESFVPHEIWHSGARPAPVTIASSQIDPPADTEVLINLAESTCPEGDWRIAEVLSADEPVRQSGRARFSAYKQAGHDLETHKL